MIQEATASLIVAITTKIIGKAIQPTLKMVRVDLVWTEPYILRLPKFYDFHGQRITLSLPTTQAASEQTYSITYPGSLANYQSIISFGNEQQTNIETINAEDEWVGATISGPGIQAGTTITAVSFVRLENSGPITMTCSTTFAMIKTTQVKVNIASLGIPWVEGQNYAIEVGEDFVIDANPDSKFGSPAKTVAYTANPPLAIVSSNPANGEGATRNNDYITMTFNRNVKPYIGQNIYVFKRVGAVDTLIKTFPTTSGIINQNIVTLDVRGLIVPSTDYYVTSDDELFKDNDNFVYNSLTGNLSYTTINDAGFKHLISLEFTFANMAVTGRRTLNWTPTSVTALVSKVFNVRRIVNPSLTGANRFAAVATLSKTLMGKRQNPGARILTSAFTLAVPVVLKVRQTTAYINSLFTTVINIGLRKGTSLAAQSSFNISATALKVIRANASLTAYVATNIVGTELFDAILDPNAFGTPDYDYFGQSASITNNYLLVGAPGEDKFVENPSYNQNVGKAYLFNPSTQTLLNTFNEPSGDSGNTGYNFGYKVKLTNNYALIGSYEGLGKIYAYNLSNFSLAFVISNPSSTQQYNSDRFPGLIEANEKYIVSASLLSDGINGNADPGVVYVFDITNQSLLYTFNTPIENTNEYPNSIALYNDTLVIGGKAYGGVGNRPVNVYNLLTGTLQSTFTQPDDVGVYDTDSFGAGVAVYGNKLAVAAPSYDQLNPSSPYNLYGVWGTAKGFADAGRVYVFDLTTNQLLYTVDPIVTYPGYNVNGNGEQFGAFASGPQMAFDDKYLIVSARVSGITDVYSGPVGRVHVYSQTNGQFLGYVENTIGGGTFLGTVVGINDNQILATAPNGTGYAQGGSLRLYPKTLFAPTTEIVTLKSKVRQTVSLTYANATSNPALISNLNLNFSIYFNRFRIRGLVNTNLQTTATLTATAKERLVPFFATTSSQATLVCGAIKTQISDMVLDYLVPTNATGNALTLRLTFRGPTKLNFNWSDGTSSSINAPTNGNGTFLYADKVVTPGQSITLVISPIDAGAITASEMSIRGDGSGYGAGALRRIYSFGSLRPTQLYIRGNSNLIGVPSSIPSSITRLEIGNAQLNDPVISGWNVSNIQEFANTFQGATTFNQPLNSWNVAGRSQFGQMFQGAQAFNQPLNNWNVTSATSFQSTFSGATAFNQDISGWRPANLLSTGMNSMFNFNTVFNQDLRGWCVTNITSEPSVLGGSTSWTNKPIWGTCP